MRFVKMHGAGNDYVYVNGFAERIDDPSALAVRISAPHFGVGADGLILVLPSEVADFRMRMFNSDGSEGRMCGNGARCVGRFVYEQGLTDKTRLTLETGGGVREIELHLTDGVPEMVTVDMGAPQHFSEKDGVYHVSMGNMNVVRAVADDPFLWEGFAEMAAPVCEKEDANILYVLPASRSRIQARVYERGSGETLACGSGACAAAVAMHAAGLCDREIDVQMRGGVLHISIRESDRHVLMTGPAETLFEGEWKGTMR